MAGIGNHGRTQTESQNAELWNEEWCPKPAGFVNLHLYCRDCANCNEFGVCFHLMDAKVPVGCKTCHAGFEFGIIVVIMYERARRQQKVQIR